MTWVEAKDLIIEFLAGACVVWLGSEIHKMRSSVETLNLRMATLVEKSIHHDRMIERHENRIEKLENTI